MMLRLKSPTAWFKVPLDEVVSEVFAENAEVELLRRLADKFREAGARVTLEEAKALNLETANRLSELANWLERRDV